MISPQNPERDLQTSGAWKPAESTLRLIAKLPAPDGLADRVHVRLRNAPAQAQVFAWPTMRTGWAQTNTLRGAAAAAIVCLVVGGGWRVYSHVQPEPTAHILFVPPRMSPAGGFSSAGARRIPDTANRPILTHEVVPAVSAADTEAVAPALPKAKKPLKTVGPPAPMLAHPRR